MQHERMIKYFLEADSKEELVTAMAVNNVNFGGGFTYDTPMKDGRKWVTWFTVSISELAKHNMVSVAQPKATKRD